MVRSGYPQPLKELLEMLSEDNRVNEVTMEDNEGNTLLHRVIFYKDLKIAEAIMDIVDQQSSSLIEFTNKSNETPLSK